MLTCINQYMIIFNPLANIRKLPRDWYGQIEKKVEDRWIERGKRVCDRKGDVEYI